MITLRGKELLLFLHDDAECVRVETCDASFAIDVPREPVKALIEFGYIEGLASNRMKLRKWRFTVALDSAMGRLGEIQKAVKDALHSDANTTVVRSSSALPSIHKRHHLEHCFAWQAALSPKSLSAAGRNMHGSINSVPGGFVESADGLTASELVGVSV